MGGGPSTPSFGQRGGRGHPNCRAASNQATLDVTVDEASRAKLVAENQLLEELLPRQLGVDELVAPLAPVADALRAAKADG